MRFPRTDIALFAVAAVLAALTWYFVADEGWPARGVVAAVCYSVAAGAVLFRRAAVTASALATFGAFAVLAATDSQDLVGISPLLVCVPLTIVAVVGWHPNPWAGRLALAAGIVGALWSPAMALAASPPFQYALHVAVLGLCYLWASRRRLERESTERDRQRAVADAREHERRRIADDLHDGLGHALTAIRAKAATEASETAPAALQTISGLAADALVDLRRTLGQLEEQENSSDRGLLQRTLVDLERLDVDMTCEPEPVALDRLEADLDPRVREVLRQVVLEALINVVRHNDAGCPVHLSFEPIRRPGHTAMLALEISNPIRRSADTGDTRGSGRGLSLIRERTSALGGVAATDGNPQRFTVKVIVPMHAPDV